MSNNLSMERFDNTTTRAVAPVIPIWQPKRKNERKRKRVSKRKLAGKDSTLFYTDPIFKPKKHDFL